MKGRLLTAGYAVLIINKHARRNIRSSVMSNMLLKMCNGLLR